MEHALSPYYSAINEDDYTMEHAFNTNIAAKYNINIAVLLHYFKYSHDNPQGDVDWLEMSLGAFQDIFPYWSSKEIQLTIEQAINLHLLKRTDGNRYSLTPLALSCYSQAGI